MKRRSKSVKLKEQGEPDEIKTEGVARAKDVESVD